MLDPEIEEHYATGVELGRLEGGASALELARTQELVERFLPSAPADVLDVGGGPGVYAAWLADKGYAVRLVDAVSLHVEQAMTVAAASEHGFTAVVGDARRLDEPDESADAVLLFGPLYHLTERDERLAALAEARRVVRPGGVVLVAAISRFTSLLDGLVQGFVEEAAFREVVERDLRDGQHRNPDGRLEWFTTAYFHHPDELRAEVGEAGLALETLVGIEGPGWLLGERWRDPDVRDHVLWAARAVESEPTLLGVSAHLFVAARRRA